MAFKERGPDTYASDSDTNNTIVATLPAAGRGMRWRVTAMQVSVSDAPTSSQRATLSFGADVQFGVRLPAAVFSPIHINFTTPLQSGDNETVTLTVPALGVGVVAEAALFGFRETI
jgi:hypothetical protein